MTMEGGPHPDRARGGRDHIPPIDAPPAAHTPDAAPHAPATPLHEPAAAAHTETTRPHVESTPTVAEVRSERRVPRVSRLPGIPIGDLAAGGLVSALYAVGGITRLALSAAMVPTIAVLGSIGYGANRFAEFIEKGITNMITKGPKGIWQWVSGLMSGKKSDAHGGHDDHGKAAAHGGHDAHAKGGHGADHGHKPEKKSGGAKKAAKGGDHGGHH